LSRTDKCRLVQVIPLWAKVWAVRILVIVGIAFLCSLADSGNPAFAFALAWGPNGLFFIAFMRGALHLPRFLEPVHPREPVLYHRVGVGLVKRLVTTRIWPMLVGFEPPLKPMNRHEFLFRTELTTKGAEICHGATFILAFSVALFCLSVGWVSAAVWILVFNMALNGYPVMLQRSNRWRIHQISRIPGQARRI
jgi:Glycosyl-4,4'-diaponeurosporenoate acyltransferase